MPSHCCSWRRVTSAAERRWHILDLINPFLGYYFQEQPAHLTIYPRDLWSVPPDETGVLRNIEIKRFRETSQLKGFKETSKLKGFIETSKLKGFIETSKLKGFREFCLQK